MSQVGDFLKDVRKRKGLSIEEAAEGTGIRAQYLEALENGEYSKIPGDVFIKGFIRNYGNYLGVDGNSLVEQYKNRAMGDSVKAVKTDLPSQKAKSFNEDTKVLPRKKDYDEDDFEDEDEDEDGDDYEEKKKSSVFGKIRNSASDVKDFIYDNIYETVDDEDDEEEQPVAFEPSKTRRHIKEPKAESYSFFNYKVFFVTLIVFAAIAAAGFMMFMGGNKPSPKPVNEKAPFTNTVKSAHSADNPDGSKTPDSAKAAQEKKNEADKEDKAKIDANADKPKEDAKDTTKETTETKETASAGTGDGVTVEITYKKPVWTQVVSDGNGVEAATIPAGTTKTYKGSKEVKVNLGSIRDVEIKVNGKVVPYGEKEWGTVEKVFTK